MELNHKIYGQGRPLIILPGLLGSLDNWQTVARALSDEFMIITIDNRNHGRSPHDEAFNYDVMVNDLKEFMESHYIHQAHLLGHSMGGKIVMEFALQHEAMVEKLIVADIAPIVYTAHHEDVFTALNAVPLKDIESRQQAESILAQYVKENDVVQFLMKALYRREDNSFDWRFNLKAIMANYENILSFREDGDPFEGPALFIRGGRSRYVQEKDMPVISRLFPQFRLETLTDAGHWLHAEKPKEFIDAVRNFLNQ